MFQQFRQQFNEFPIITLRDIQKSFPGFDSKNLINWQKKGFLIKLRNGYYLLTESKIDEFRLYQIANKLYEPSYISLESALNFYGIIPEGVYQIQSVSTLKTEKFATGVGTFNYRTIKKELYFGYSLVTKNNCTFRMATGEKAVLDFLYLRSDIDNYLSFESLRWNRTELQQINENILRDYLGLYNSPKLNKKIEFLKAYLNASY
jgi:predicted transcriptional regulator of viral defense system